MYKTGVLLRGIFKMILWVFLGILVLVLFLLLLLKIPAARNAIAEKASAALSEKFNATVRLKSFELGLLRTVNLQELHVESPGGDSLLYFSELAIDLDLPALLNNKIFLRNIEITDLNARVERFFPDTTYNYAFIIDAFSSQEGEEVPADTSGGSWAFGMGHIKINNTRLRYFDDNNGMDLLCRIGKLNLAFEEFDLDKSSINVEKLLLDNSNVVVKMMPPLAEKEEEIAEASSWLIGAGELTITQSTVNFSDQSDSSSYVAAIGDFNLEKASINLAATNISLELLKLHKSTVDVQLGKSETSSEAATDSSAADSAAPWQVTVAKIDLEQNNVSFRDSEPKSRPGFNPADMGIADLTLKAKKAEVKGSDISVLIQKLAFKEKSGFDLQQLAADIKYHEKGISVKNLDIRTPGSRIGNRLEVSYASIDSVTALPAQTRIDVDLVTQIKMGDVLYFMPALSNSLQLSPEEKIGLQATIKGSLADVNADVLLKWKQSSVLLRGNVREALVPEKVFINIEQFVVKSGSEDLQMLVPAGTIPENISLPSELSLKGDFTGYLKKFNTKLQLSSSLGDVQADVQMDPSVTGSVVPYTGSVKSTSLQLGRLLNSKDLGQLTFSVALDGKGFDTSAFDTDISLHLQNLGFKGYNYKDLTLSGKLVRSAFTGSASMRDNNLAFDFNGMVNLNATAPDFSFVFDLKGADLKQLKLSEDDVRLSLDVKANLSLPDKSNPIGNAGVYNLLLVKEGRQHRVDSLVLRSFAKDDLSFITLQSEKLSAGMQGRFLLEELGPSLNNYVNSHFDLDHSASDSLVPAQQMTFEINLKDPAFLSSGLIPGLSKITPAKVKGEYNSSKGILSTNVDVDEIVYNNIRIDSIDIDVLGSPRQLAYRATLSQVSDSVNFKFENLSLGGEMKNNRLAFLFSTSRDDSSRVLELGGNVVSADSFFTLSFSPDMVLNASKWQVNSANTIKFGNAHFNIQSLTLNNGAQSVSASHRSAHPSSPLELVFKDFELETLSGMMLNKDLLVQGRMNGNVLLEKQNEQSAFRSDLSINDLAFKAGHIGNLTLKADNFEDPSVYDIDLGIVGGDNDLSLKGSYNTSSKTNNLDLALNIISLQMTSIEPFTGGEVTRMAGWIAGDIRIKGEPSKPLLKGAIHLHELGFKPKIIDSYLRLPGGELLFASQKVSMKGLTVFDTLNNKAVMGGYVDIADLSKLSFDLNLQTQDFLAMNTDKSDNPLYFGRLFLDSEVRIYGTAAKPTVKAKARLNKKSTLTYIKPEEQILKNESEGIVEFTDSLENYTRIMNRKDSAAVKGIEGLELNAEITVDEGVDIKVIVDPLAGDSLYIQGGGKLNFSMDRNGSTGLAGKYNIKKGGYFLTISDFVKRDFKIDPGSSVTWSGDPLDAYVDLSAIYEVKASPVELVQDQMAGLTEQEANKYRNLLKFHVYLTMTGFMSAPQISFDIKLAPENRGAMGGAVNSRLAQLKEDENQLNKQVFALLTLRRFVAENPLESSGGGGLSSAGRSSASKVLTQQLNSLSDKYVNFVDLDLGVNSYEDYSTGQQEGRTQVQVGVSKQLFNDRVTVRVGGNVDIEGERARQNTANDVAGNISVEYKLVEDGRYRIKAFRQNEYENPIEGEIIKTGAGFIFSRDFNKFKYMFRKPRSAQNEKKRKK